MHKSVQYKNPRHWKDSCRVLSSDCLMAQLMDESLVRGRGKTDGKSSEAFHRSPYMLRFGHLQALCLEELVGSGELGVWWMGS